MKVVRDTCERDGYSVRASAVALCLICVQLYGCSYECVWLLSYTRGDMRSHDATIAIAYCGILYVLDIAGW